MMTFYQLINIPKTLQDGCISQMIQDENMNELSLIIDEYRRNEALGHQLRVEKRNFGMSPLHLAVLRNSRQTAQLLIDSITKPSERLEILNFRTEISQQTAMHLAASNALCADILQVLTESVFRASVRYELLKELCGEGKTVLQYAVGNKNLNAIDILMNATPADKKLEYITSTYTEIPSVQAAIHMAASSGDSSTMDRLLSHLEPDEVSAALVCVDSSNNNLLHLTIDAEKDIETAMRYVLDKLNMEHQQKLLWETNIEGLTPLHYAAMKGAIASIELLLSYLTTPCQLTALTCKHNGQTLFKMAESSCSTNSRIESLKKRALLDDLFNKLAFEQCMNCKRQLDKLIKLVLEETKHEKRHETMRDILRGVMPWELLMKRSIQQAVTYMTTLSDRSEVEILLQHKSGIYHNRTILHLAAQAGDMELVTKILNIAGHEMRSTLLDHRDDRRRYPVNLTKNAEVRRLLEWSKRMDGYYYLPTPPAVLIIFNTADREGADDEMISIAQVMPKFGLIPTIRKNLNEQQILDAIRQVQEKEGEELSGMIVVMMSHGEQGAIHDNNGQAVPIQDIINQMTPPILDGIPKVLVMQCCQNDSRVIAPQADAVWSASDREWRRVRSCRPERPPRRVDAQVALSSNSNANFSSWPRRRPPAQLHVPDTFYLTRPNMSLLISTVRGGLSERNKFIPILAQQLLESDDTDDVHSVFLRTHRQMAEKQAAEQVPLHETTMKYKLNLRMIFKRKKRASGGAESAGCITQ